MMQVSENVPFSQRTLEQLFGDSLTSSLCVNSHSDTKMWVITGMLAHHLESFTDSVVVRDSIEKEERLGDHPVGIVGGKEVIENVFFNPHSNLFDKTAVEDIMFNEFAIVTKHTKLFELLDSWKLTRRAFAIIPNELHDYSAISAKKLLEIGMKVKTDITISYLPKKKAVTFNDDDQIGDIMNLMLKNKTRKLLLENSTKFISDRIIVGKIAEDLKFLHDVENFLSLPIKNFELGEAKVPATDLTIPDASKVMHGLEHPYLVFQDQVISPWDICMMLLSDELTEYQFA